VKDFLKSLIERPIDTLVLIGAVALLLVSFISFSLINGQSAFEINAKPNAYLFGPGCLLLILFIWRNRRQTGISANENRDYAYRLEIDSDHLITISKKDISDIVGDQYSAFILPANTSLNDTCITDDRSALGSFFLRRFPAKISEMQELIARKAREVLSLEEHALIDVQPGFSLLLRNVGGSVDNVIIVAVSENIGSYGIQATTNSIVQSVKNAFRIASENGFSTINMPIIGTGHGGVDFSMSLMFICLQGIAGMKHEGNHHIKLVNLIIYDPENKRKMTVKSIAAIMKSYIAMSYKGR